LPQVKKISSGQVKKYPGQRQAGLLFTAGQKYVRVGPGPIFKRLTLLGNILLLVQPGVKGCQPFHPYPLPDAMTTTVTPIFIYFAN